MPDDSLVSEWETSHATYIACKRDTPGIIARDLRRLILLAEQCLEQRKRPLGEVPTATADAMRTLVAGMRQRLSELMFGCIRFGGTHPKKQLELLGYFYCIAHSRSRFFSRGNTLRERCA